MSNKGFINQGGTVHVGQMAIGDGAAIHAHEGAPAPGLRATLDALAEAVRAADLPAARRAALDGVVQDLRDEACHPAPDPATLAGGLDYVAKMASSASAVVTAVGVVRHVIGLFA